MNAPYPMPYGGPRQFGGRGFGGGQGRGGRDRGEQYYNMQYYPTGVPYMPPFEQYMNQQPQQQQQPLQQQSQQPQQQHGYNAYANIGSFHGYQGGHWNPYTNQFE